MKKLESVTRFDKTQGIYFAISCVAALIILAVGPEWVWVTFPFVCTFFVKMFDWI
jgi:hypothetical protein